MRYFADMVMNLRKKVGNILISWADISFLSRTLLQGVSYILTLTMTDSIYMTNKEEACKVYCLPALYDYHAILALKCNCR
jgi:hypothetical protein